MKYLLYILPFVLTTAAVDVRAQTQPCRSANAAARGGQAGLNRDREASEQVARNEKLSSEILGRCVNGVSIVLTAPQFPSYAEIFNAIKNQVCRIASDSVSNAVNGVVTNVNGQINGALNGINDQITNTGIGQLTGGAPQVTGGTVSQGSTVNTNSTQFWSDIWR